MDILTNVIISVGALAFLGSMLERWIPAWFTRRFLFPEISVGLFYFLDGLSLRSVVAALAAAFFSVVLLHLLDGSNVKVVRRR